MTLNPRFIDYFRETFFSEKPEEFEAFLGSLEKGIPRTIRIRPGKENAVKKRLSQYGFILGDTYIPNVFTLDRSEDFAPLERRIGFSLDHLVGNFYIQELAAATSVHILTDGKIHDEYLTILDMAASPGGKTTQLAEMYPNSFIVANEPTRERIPQLLQNLDRMGSANIGVTLYPGQYFRHTPEIFDRILLDAPCSGEGTLYKGTEATKHWHIKNIKNIASLQAKLLDAAIVALKVGGEMVYSTCSMNLLENEGVLESIAKKYPDTFRITYQKHFWPHIDGTGGFFVAKIEKYAHISTNIRERPQVNNENISLLGNTTIGKGLKTGYILYEHEGKVLILKNHPKLEELREKYYFMRFGEKIGEKEGESILLSPFSHRYVEIDDIERYELSNEKELDGYLRGGSLKTGGKDRPLLIVYQGVDIALEEVRDTIIPNRFPRDWQRK